MYISKLLPVYERVREWAQVWKVKFFANKYVSGLALFLKSDGFVMETRNLVGKIHPFFYENFYKIWARIFLALVFFFIAYGLFWRAPFSFPDHSIATVERGATLSQIANMLEKGHFIFSSMWFKVFVTLVGGQRQIIAGDYYFEKPISVFSVTKRLLRGNFGLTQLRVYIPEGLNSKEMADQIALTLPKFNKAEFIAAAKPEEGYLFPDTYFFTPNQKPAEIVAFMKDNFARQINPYQADIEKSGKSLEEIVTMASIVQDEAAGADDARVIAGILWKQLKMDMPLQADSTLRYVTGKGSASLTKAELEDEGNPYNTYTHKGLPPTPISNPGIEAIKAAIAPTNTDYLYFLHDSAGRTHYAVDFEQHKRNKEAYLR